MRLRKEIRELYEKEGKGRSASLREIAGKAKNEGEKLGERTYSIQEDATDRITEYLARSDGTRGKVFNYGRYGNIPMTGRSFEYLKAAMLDIYDVPEEDRQKLAQAIMNRAERIESVLGKIKNPNKYMVRELNLLEKSLEREFGAKRTREDVGVLESALVVSSVLGLAVGLFFFSSNFTGNTIGNLTTNSSNIIGALMLILGIGSFALKIRKKRNIKDL